MDMSIQVGQPAPQFTCNAVVDNLLKGIFDIKPLGF